MKKNYLSTLLLGLLLTLNCAALMAQVTVTGTVKDGDTGETLAGVNVLQKGTINGTITNQNGEYTLKVNQAPPFTLSFSFIGFKPVEVQVTNETKVDVTLESQPILGQEIVIGVSRVEESIMKSPVTVDKLDVLSIRQAPAPDWYDALANVKGVQVNNGSLNFTAVNTRGFATISNTRFVQLVDGMDTQAPLLNFPTGTIMGLSELDAESMEIVPGAASALYGPNAFNGIMIMKSKSPFDAQGLSMQVKQGVTDSKAGGSHPLGQYSIRYAKAFNNKFAFKVNFSYMGATDWTGNDYKTDRLHPESTTDLSKNPNFDGLNVYGDEANFDIPLPAPYPVLNVNRTGFKEAILLDNHKASTIKGDVALHYRLTDKVEASYTYRYGGGNSLYQGQAKYALRDFNQQFHKLELKGSNWFLRGYLSATDAGKSYNMDALGGYINEAYSPTETKWAPDYAQGYILAIQGYNPFTGQTDNSAAGNAAAAHAVARRYADRYMIDPNTGNYMPGFQDSINTVRRRFFQRNPPGASFYDNSKLWHAEGYYNFDKIKWAEIIAGANFRQYSLFSNATIFDEAPVDANNPKRIFINTYGMYAQISKTLNENLKLTGSLRYDKMDNFKGHVTPRISAVYTVAQNHNFRASFQTGFRFPDTQAQYIYFYNPTGILLGGVPSNASRYGVYGNGSYTMDSYNDWVTSGGTVDPTTHQLTGGNMSLLKTANLEYVKPEQLWSYEVGYKSNVLDNKLLIDLNYYYTQYKDFLGEQYVRSANPTTHQGSTIAAGTVWYPYVNSPYTLSTFGIGAGLSYVLPRNFVVSGNYNYATFSGTQSDDFQSNFNTPQNKYNIGVSNRKITKNIGFAVNYRYQQSFEWQSSYGVWQVPAYGVLDAQLSYKMTPIKTIVKIGGTNIGGGDYRTNLGSPFIGQQYYISVTFDEFLK